MKNSNFNVQLVSTLLMTCCSKIQLFFNREVDNKLINLVDCRFLAIQFGSVITLQIHKIECQPELKEEILLSIFDYVDCFISFLKNE